MTQLYKESLKIASVDAVLMGGWFLSTKASGRQIGRRSPRADTAIQPRPGSFLTAEGRREETIHTGVVCVPSISLGRGGRLT